MEQDHHIGNRLGKFAPTAVKGLYMYPMCGEKGVHCVFIPSTGRIRQVKSFRLAVDHGLGQLLVQYADKSSPQSIDPIFRPYADPSVDPESLETDGVQPQSRHDQGVTTDKDDPTTTTDKDDSTTASKLDSKLKKRVKFDASEQPRTRSAAQGLRRRRRKTA